MIMNMETKRLFIGTSIDREIFEYIYEPIKQDFSEFCQGKWVELNNLHFTYSFLGDIEKKLITDIVNEMKGILTTYETELVVCGMGVFPENRSPRILYAEARTDDRTLLNVHEQIQKKIIKLGLDVEDKEFKPHVTLLRIKSIRSPRFNDLLQKYRKYGFGTMARFSVDLIESTLTPTGPFYKKIPVE